MSAPQIPKMMKALVTQADKTAAVKEIPVPTIDSDEILVEVVAVAQNPTDWKHIKYMMNEGTIVGCDWSGYVVQTGKEVTTLVVGDHVAGFVQGGTYKDRGAFAQYVKTPAELAWKVPQDLSHEEAATMGCSYWTAVQALFHPTRLGLVEPPKTVDKEEWVLVYGGSGSVGLFAIQLAKAAGYKIVTTASPRNFALCKSLGADAIFDYHEANVVDDIKKVTRDSIRVGLDAISEASAQKISVQAFTPGGGKLITILAPDAEAQDLRPDVAVQATLIYTSLGREFSTPAKNVPASPEDREHMVQFLKETPELVMSGKVKPNLVKVWDGGLNAIDDGLQYMMEGKNSGEKIVYRLK